MPKSILPASLTSLVLAASLVCGDTPPVPEVPPPPPPPPPAKPVAEKPAPKPVITEGPKVGVKAATKETKAAAEEKKPEAVPEAKLADPKPEPVVVDPVLEKLIVDLGSGDYRKREQAMAQIRRRGLSALPALRRALGSPDPEVRRRLVTLVPTLETEALLAPKRVTLNVENKQLHTVFEEITRQTGYKISFWSSTPNQVISLKVKDMPFWEAIDHICLKAGISVQQSYGDKQVRLQGPSSTTPYVAHSGSFRLVANNIQQYRTIDLNSGNNNNVVMPFNRNESLTFSFTLYCEPNMGLLGVDQSRLIAAYDSEKNSMLMPAQDDNPYTNPWGFRGRMTSRYGNGNRQYFLQTQVQLNRVSEKASRIKVLRGTVPVTLLVEEKPTVVADNILKAKGKKTKIGNTHFHIEDIKEMPGKQYQLKVSISEQNPENPNDYSWNNSIYQRIELVDDKGNKFQTFGTSWNGSGPSNVQMTITYGTFGAVKMGPPSKFIFHQWITRQHNLNFEFRDIPLP